MQSGTRKSFLIWKMDKSIFAGIYSAILALLWHLWPRNCQAGLLSSLDTRWEVGISSAHEFFSPHTYINPSELFRKVFEECIKDWDF